MTRTLSILHADLALNLLNNSDLDFSVVYSPISIAVTFSMAFLGSYGDTRKEIGKYLINNEDDKILHERFNQFMSQQSDTLKSVNKMYVKNGLKLEEEFVDNLKKYYNDQLEQIEFSEPDSIDKINMFVKESTGNTIRNLISQGDIDNATSVILINAIHFKGHWKVKFNKNSTTDENFYTTRDNIKKVKMMYKKDKYYYYEDEEFKIVELNYEGGEQRMILLLPQEKCSLLKKMKSINGKKLFEMIDSMSDYTVNLYLPKFKIESSHRLKETLKKIGLKKAFSDSADFSKICKDERLSISQIIQKAFIEVDEEGTEAAAVTSVIFAPPSVGRSYKPPHQFFFKADHPFMYFILDGKDNILFNGIYV
uniref:SERPIN domain-containing protein n=1 Tax=Parastrongyloides trichosuri TaxID=131310 RepID=A0A0N4ZGJ6_PARTI